jgi:hypothetical protein
VTSLAWLSGGSGFISGGLDRKIIQWVCWLFLWHVPSHFFADYYLCTQDADGTLHENWGETPIRVTDLAITPDLTRLVTVGMYYHPNLPPTGDSPQPTRNNGDAASISSGENGVLVNGSKGPDNRMIVYDLLTKQTESCVEI